MFVSFASPHNSTSGFPKLAYDRPFTRLDLKALFAEPAPTALLPSREDA